MGRKVYDWGAIQRHYDAGKDRDACMARFGFTISTWYRAISAGRLRARVDRRLIDWASVQGYYDGGRTYQQCRKQFGFAAGSWSKAVQRGVLVPRPSRLPLERILAESKSRRSIKRRLMQAGLLVNHCDECGLVEWRAKPLSMQVHHRNGIRDDHSVANLAMLCPNCHSQTATFAARNKKQTGMKRRIEMRSRVV
jgi:5-methylcytosine-specific restriction endonuclease McrA